MKIAVIQNEDVSSGGAFSAEVYFTTVLEELSRQKNVEFHILKIQHTLLSSVLAQADRLVIELFKSILFGQLLRKWNIVYFSKLERKLNRKGIDFVIFFGNYNQMALLSKIPFVVCIWDLGHRDLVGFPETYQLGRFEFRERGIQEATSKAFKVLTDSYKTSSRLESIYGVEMNRSLPVTLFPPESHSILSSIPKKRKVNFQKFVLYPANFWKHKNHQVLVEALNYNLSSSIESFDLIFVGSDKGNKESVFKLVEKYGLQEKVKFLDFVARTELLRLYNDCSALVYPSLLGPTNIPPLEAVMHGIKVFVATGAASNLIGFKGVYEICPHDTLAWAKALEMRKTETKNFSGINSSSVRKLHQVNVENLQALLAEMQDYVRPLGR